MQNCSPWLIALLAIFIIVLLFYPANSALLTIPQQLRSRFAVDKTLITLYWSSAVPASVTFKNTVWDQFTRSMFSYGRTQAIQVNAPLSTADKALFDKSTVLMNGMSLTIFPRITKRCASGGLQVPYRGNAVTVMGLTINLFGPPSLIPNLDQLSAFAGGTGKCSLY